jgi:hypothetical protein
MSDAQEPSFSGLLRSNARLLTLVLLYVGVAFGVWHGLVWLFPDFSWLRMPSS